MPYFFQRSSVLIVFLGMALALTACDEDPQFKDQPFSAKCLEPQTENIKKDCSVKEGERDSTSDASTP